MQAVNWQQFGLMQNPYDIRPVSEGGVLSMEKAFVGRVRERKMLNTVFQSEQRLCIAVCGDIGVGKTSLVNMHKYHWKYAEKRLLFSSRREIEATPYLLNKKNFLVEIIGSLLREIALIDPKLMRFELLKKLNVVVDITQTVALSGGVSASAFGIGVNVNREKTTEYPIQLSIASLEQYVVSLVQFIKTHDIANHRYSGVIIHVDNFDIVLEDPAEQKRVVQFFHEIRDILQMPDVYVLFVGPKQFFQKTIRRHERIASLFYPTPLMLDPLTKEEIVYALNERMHLLQSKSVKQYIPPFEDGVIHRLYDLYNGDVRSIMGALTDILSQCSDQIGRTLTTDEAMVLLGQECWDKVRHLLYLTREQKIVLFSLAKRLRPVNAKDIAGFLGKPTVNTGYTMRPLKDAGIVEIKKSPSGEALWMLAKEYIPLREFTRSLRKVQRKAQEASRSL